MYNYFDGVSDVTGTISVDVCCDFCFVIFNTIYGLCEGFGYCWSLVPQRSIYWCPNAVFMKVLEGLQQIMWLKT